MKQKILIFDGNSILNRAYFALPPLNDDSGNNVNAVFGFMKILNKAIADFAPDKFVVAFDEKGHNFRKDIFPDYKANRHGMPDDLAAQIPILRELLTLLNVKYYAISGVEADDIIGTIVKTATDSEKLIVSGDRDMLQLVSSDTTVVLTKKGISETENVTPDVLAANYQLTPSQVIDYKALRGDTSDNIPGVAGVGEKTAMALLTEYHTLDAVYENIDKIKGSLQQKLAANKDLAYISRRLATIVCDVPLDVDTDSFSLPVYSADAMAKLASLKFRSILAEVKSDAPESAAAHCVETVEISTAVDLATLCETLAKSGKIAVVFDSAIYLANEKNKEYKIVISDNFLDELTAEIVFGALKGVLEAQTSKVMFDIKQQRHFLTAFGITLNGANFDVALMQYLTETTSAKKLSDLLAQFNFGGTAAGLFCLCETLSAKLDELNLTTLYTTMELPLSDLLYRMECAGVKVDTDQLSALSVQFKSKIDEVSREIFELTGGEQFNIASPKQLSVVLFEKLKLQHFQKTQTGYSTNNDVLEKLKDAHPVVEKIITYRSYTKLLGTYIDGLRPLLKSNKVHTTFNQYLTTTGRLSSSEPNMQNIPIRDDLGKEIRRLFVSNNGQFVAADYSQIELRLLAGFSADENLLSAFKSGEDIHRKVAAEIFGVPAAMVTSAMRRTAKAVNFGIIYGQGAYGLSEGIGIPVYKAKQYIEMYFDRFPTIKTYLDGAIAAAKKQGYVTTFTGRRRYLPEINSSNHNLAAFGERAAMNMPLQGSAADIMKIAMLKVDEALRKEGLKSQIVLQIHDEVVVDCFDDEIEAVEKILKREMENAVDFNCPLTVEVERGGSLYEV